MVRYGATPQKADTVRGGYYGRSTMVGYGVSIEQWVGQR